MENILFRNCCSNREVEFLRSLRNDRHMINVFSRTTEPNGQLQSPLKKKKPLSKLPDGWTHRAIEIIGGESVEVITEEKEDGNGGVLYLIGTSHVSSESYEAVNKLLTIVKPQIVVLELCPARAGVTGSKIFAAARRKLNLKFILDAVAEIGGGLLPAMIFYAMSYTEQFISRTLRTDYGGNMRVAIRNPIKQNYQIMLGDRPNDVTLKRLALTLSAKMKTLLTFFTTLAAFFGLRCFLVNLAPELMADRAFMDVLVREREIYLTRSMQRAVRTKIGDKPIKVVGIVGRDHVEGILNLWDSVTDDDVASVMDTHRL